ncbi:tail fiber domain-containing protein [Parabacteroides sp. APC149_11_2_Y6]
MEAGDIIFEDGTIVTPNDMEKLMPALVALISSTQKDPGQYEEVKSLQGVSSLPVFQQAGNVYKLVRVAVELLKGVDGREIYLQVNADRTYIQWRWTDGVWQNLYKIEDLRGEPVVLRTGSQGIEWKYRDEADTAWRILVTYEVLKLKYSDLTPEQVEDLWRHLPADVLAQFQKPATDAATEVRKKMDGITEEANALMDDVRELESSVSTAESGRVNAEKGRVDAESARRVAEVNRENSEDERETAETGRVNAESARVSNENARKTAETGRVNAENTRVSQENARKTAETGRVDAEKARVTAENNRVTEFATLKQNAETATANANDTANHPTYIGEDNYVYKWNKATKAYDKTDIYVKGDAFSIKKVYASVAALQADVNNAEIEVGDFVLVNTNNVEDPDNAKLYVKVQNTNGSYAYDFLVDMSGAIGFTGKTPQFSIGTVSSGVTPAVTLSENGVDSNGNPRYKLNLVLPKGEKGKAPVLQIGTITTGTPGGQASASITANGFTPEGAPIFKLNMTIPQGPQGKGNVSVVESGLVSGKTYLFKPSANNSATGTLVDADEKYLKLTGGTITDRIHFNSTTPDNRFIDFYKGSDYIGAIGIDDSKLVLNNHISGSQLQLRNDGEILYRNQKVWYAGNDGSGSGLDADLLDGKHSSAFALLDANGKVAKAIIADSANTVAWNNVASKPSWIGANKPTYTASEVGALPSGGTAVAATKLATARTINGVAFDGTANITITAAANGGNSATVGGKNLDSLFVTNKEVTNLDTTGSSWSNTYSPTSAGTIPVANTYGTILQVSNHPNTAPGNGGIYPFQIGFSTDNSLSFRSRFDTTAWTAWRKFIFEGDSRLTNARPASDVYAWAKAESKPSYKMQDIGDADSIYVDVNTIQRKILVAGTKVNQGYVSRVAIGLEHISSSFSNAVLSVGLDDNGTIWRNYFFDTVGHVGIYGNYIAYEPNCGLYNKYHNYLFAANPSGWYTATSIRASGGFFKESDRRLKSNIKPLKHTLDQILSIPTSIFIMDGKEQIGSIAQDIEKICPEIVSENFKKKSEVPERDDWEVEVKEEHGEQVKYVKVKQVEYEMLGVLALEGLKLLNQKVDNLKKQLNIK